MTRARWYATAGGLSPALGPWSVEWSDRGKWRVFDGPFFGFEQASTVFRLALDGAKFALRVVNGNGARILEIHPGEVSQ